MSRVIVDKLQEFTRHPFGGGILAADGIQFSTEVPTININENVIVAITNALAPLAVTDGPGGAGTIKEIEFGLTSALKCNAGVENITYQWQGRNADGAWTTITNAVVQNVTATYQEFTRSGYFAPVANFNQVPFDLKLIMQCDDATNVGYGKVKNSSYCKVIYKIS